MACLVLAGTLGLGRAGGPAAAQLPPPGPSVACAEGEVARPLLVALHGFGSSPDELLAESRLAQAARDAGAVLVAPAAHGSPARWSTPDGLTAGAGIDHVTRAVTAAAERRCVDLGRIVVAGYSNGALMSTWLACTWGSRVSAVVLVSGANLGPACDTPEGVAALAVHGVEDPVVPVQGGPVLGGALEAEPWSTVEARWPGAEEVLVADAVHAWPADDVADRVEQLLRSA